jgi:hypothetical protein
MTGRVLRTKMRIAPLRQCFEKRSTELTEIAKCETRCKVTCRRFRGKLDPGRAAKVGSALKQGDADYSYSSVLGTLKSHPRNSRLQIPSEVWAGLRKIPARFELKH